MTWIINRWVITYILLMVIPLISQTLEQSNGIITVKMDLTRGGTISYLSLSGVDRNLVNIHDEGRYIQQSYYAGENRDRQSEGQSPDWSPWPWNPIQAGDYARNRAEILVDSTLQNGELYVKCIPMLWDMDNQPADATMEQWVRLDSNVMEVRNKITINTIPAEYGVRERSQEEPAVYPIAALNQIHSYFGENPFEGDSLDNPEVINLSSGFWGRYDTVTENWMAFTDQDGFGMGVYNPVSSRFLAGMAGNASTGEATDGTTSYIAPINQATLESGSTYEYTYYIIVGTVSQIRERVYRLNDPVTIIPRNRRNLLSPHAYRLILNHNGNELTASFNSPVSEKVRFQITDLQGKVLLEESRWVNKGSNRIVFKTKELAQGLYILQKIRQKDRNK